MKKEIAVILIFIINSLFAQVAINQLGYLPKAQKIVYFTSDIKSFNVVDQKTGDIMFSGRYMLGQETDAATGQTIYIGDFSSFGKPGEYIIKGSNNTESVPFSINADVYNNLYQESLKSFYIQRCGMELTKEFAGDFAHPACHIEKAIYHKDVKKTGTREVSGGWHDAGDYGRYIVNGAYSVAVMLLGYEMFPAGFQYYRTLYNIHYL